MSTDHERAVAEMGSAGEGWWQVAIIIGFLSAIAGGGLGYVTSLECTTGLFASCDPSGDTPLYIAIGGMLGVVPALPLLAIAQLYRHLAKVERLRNRTSGE